MRARWAVAEGWLVANRLHVGVQHTSARLQVVVGNVLASGLGAS